MSIQPSPPPIRVLVVDDSAFARKVLREVLNGSPGIEVVDIARDGLDALEKIGELKPDVVTLDLMMPNLDGIGVLRALPQEGAPRVVVVSMADEESELAISALQAGAVELVHKPTALAIDRLYELSGELVEKVRAAAVAKSPQRSSASPEVKATPSPARSVEPEQPCAYELLVIGASTGGPQALNLLLKALPANFPVPVAVVLHMPVGFTHALARRLNGECALHVSEAAAGAELTRGHVVVARAGIHLRVSSTEGVLRTELDPRPTKTPHRPAVDILFQSAAEACGKGVLGVVLTGMGDDGLVGSRAVTDQGGIVLTESESSCVVYGMPRVIAEAGLSGGEAPIESMAKLIFSKLWH